MHANTLYSNEKNTKQTQPKEASGFAIQALLNIEQELRRDIIINEGESIDSDDKQASVG